MMRYQFLLRELVLRDLKVRYAGSYLGFLWAFVHPIWQLLIYSVVFSGIATGVIFLLRISVGGIAWTRLPAILVAMAIQLLLTCGIAPLLAAVYLHLRDVTHALNVVISFPFVLTPIVYPLDTLAQRFALVVALNPLSTVVAAYCRFFVRNAPPSLVALLGPRNFASAVFPREWTVFSRSGTFTSAPCSRPRTG